MQNIIKNALYLYRKATYPHDAASQRSYIKAALDKAGDNGMTRDELVFTTGIPLQSMTWRVSELKSKHVVSVQRYGFSGVPVCRETRQGRFAEVLVKIA